MSSRTTRLDPRTNDPYINKKGQLEMASLREELLQRFDILVHTRAGTIPLNVSYGIDYDWIRDQKNYDPEQAFLLELVKRIDLKMEPLIANFDIDSIDQVGNSVFIKLLVRGTNEISSAASVTL